MLIENQRQGRLDNNKLLAELQGYSSTPEPKISSIQKAQIQYRIAKELNDRHAPRFIAINNK